MRREEDLIQEKNREYEENTGLWEEVKDYTVDSTSELDKTTAHKTSKDEVNRWEVNQEEKRDEEIREFNVDRF